MENSTTKPSKECDSEITSKMSEVKSPNESQIVCENGINSNAIRDKVSGSLGSEDDDCYMPVKRIRLDYDGNSVDAAETINKIQAFIALGKSHDVKSGSEPIEEPFAHNTLSKKVLGPKGNCDKASEVDNINELHRTLQGLDDSGDNVDQSEANKTVNSRKPERNAGMPSPLKENNHDFKSSEKPVKSSDLLTPSRISQRIQSKSVKFSAKELLKGVDVTVSKRTAPGLEKEKKRGRGRPPKVMKDDLKKAEVVKSSVVEDEQPEIGVQNEVSSKGIDKQTLSPNISPIIANHSPASSHCATLIVSPSSACPTTTSVPETSLKEIKPLVEKISALPPSNGKITLELKQKKVVRIAVPPKSSPLPKTSLGPDIIIKRVKPVKKNVSLPENLKEPKEHSKSVTEKEIEHPSQPSNVPHILKMSPRVSIERLSVKTLKDDLVKIQYFNLKKPSTESPLPLKDADREKVTDSSPSTVDKNGERNKSVQEEQSLTEQISEALENTNRLQEMTESPQKILQNKPIRGRKPNKSTPPNEKPKFEITPKKTVKLRKKYAERSPSISDEEPPEEPEEELTTLFDKYFSTDERYVEHYDSLDSDSDLDFDNEIYTHFLNLKRNQNEKKRGEATVYDLMHDISIELPTWNIHASSNGETFYLVQVDSSEDKPLMRKVVEIDLDNNAKVYVDNKLVPRYEGKYDSYEDIRQLIYTIDQL